MAAPEIHSAFRGRLVGLLMLRTAGHHLWLPPAEVSVYFLRWNGFYFPLPSSCSSGSPINNMGIKKSSIKLAGKNPNDEGALIPSPFGFNNG